MSRYSDTKKVSIIGITANLFLFIIKIVIGVSSRSQGLLADAINSGTDVFNALMTFIGNKLASKPKDKDHPYGHGKVEYVFSLMISIFMIMLSFRILQNSITAILIKQTVIFSYYLIAVCIITIIVKLSLFFYTTKIGKSYENLLITAASEDHRNDVFLTSATLIGIICSKFGLYYVDGVVGILISIWISYVAIKIFLAAYYVLIDTTISDTLKEKITAVIDRCNNCAVDSIISKPVGVNYILLIEISVDDDISLEQGHKIAEEIKNEVCKVEKIVDAIVHVNPED